MAEEDLIFGKNRHFFGGIEPSNMQVFTAELADGVIRLTATLPTDTVINEQTLCTVAGAVIRRKTGDYPKDEFDGDLVADLKMSSVFADTGAAADGTYYYAAFPYSAQGVYNRNTVNRSVVNEPEPMKKFVARTAYDSSTDTISIKLICKLPDVSDGAVIRRSLVSYPTAETEGELVQTITADGTYLDSNVSVGLTYYYTAFPYTSTMAYNRSESNRASATAARREYLYGFDINVSTASPSGRVYYPSDVDNADYTPAKMDYSTSKFDYGSWTLEPGEHFMPRPCMLYNWGKVAYYLNPNDLAKKADGTASDVANTSFDGNAMMEWPKIYTKRWEEDGVYHFRCSDMPQDADWDCWCNYDRQDNVIPHFYTAIYEGSYTTAGIRSLSGQVNKYDSNITKLVDVDKYARWNGDDWYFDTLADRLLINDLLILLAKSTDSQTAYGKGYCGRSSNTVTNLTSGAYNAYGMFYGTNSAANIVKVFGMECYWGNSGRPVAGWMFNSGSTNVAPYLKITRGTHDGTTVSDYQVDSISGYLDYGVTISSGSITYISKMKTYPFGRLPSEFSGSSTQFEADGNYRSLLTGTAVGYICMPMGGNAFGAEYACGMYGFCVVNAVTSSDYRSQAAPSCKPLLSIQEGD